MDKWDIRFTKMAKAVAEWSKDQKGGGFYDKLGSDIGTKNPKKSALAAFIDKSG